MKRPSLENLTTRALLEALPPWPSETKISPLAAIATPVGRSKVSEPLPPTPILPSIINTLPFWSSLRTSCPRTTPAALRAGMPSTVCLSLISLTHRLPSLSTVNPCGFANTPPRLLSSLPEGSNCKIGGLVSPRPTHVAMLGGTVLKQRWKTQILPSLWTCTRMTLPQRPPFMLSGRVGQPSTGDREGATQSAWGIETTGLAQPLRDLRQEPCWQRTRFRIEQRSP